MSQRDVNKKIVRTRIGPIAEGLLGVLAVSGAVTLAALLPGAAVALTPFLKKKKYSAKQAIERNIDSMFKRGLIEKQRKKNGKTYITLTKKGRWEAFIRQKYSEGSVAQRKWDSLWRIVIFDVPYEKRKMRDELRRAMKMYGFTQLQQSVWVYPYACDDFVSLLKSHLGVTNDVLYIKAKYIENSHELKKEFKIV